MTGFGFRDAYAATRAVALAAFLLLPFWVAAASAQEADLSMSKSAPGSAAANTDITYILTALNNGPDDAPTVTVTDSLPAGLTFVSLSAPPGWSCTPPSVGANGTVTCDNLLVPAGASATFTLVAHIPAGTAPGTFITNVATVTTTAFDPNDENNSAAATTVTSGGSSADVAITKAGPDTVQAGQNIVYTLTAGNTGPDTASSVQISDTLSGNTTFVSLTSPGGWTCTTPGVGAGGTVNCSIASLAPGPLGTFTLTVNVPAGTAVDTFYNNSATISSTTPDPGLENNTAVAGTTVVAATTDLTLTKSHTGNATQGQTGFQYTIAVSNVGTVSTSGLVSVDDTLPAGLTATAVSGPGWTCSVGATSSCNRSDALAGGGSYPPITLTVNVAPNAPATVTNTATVSGGNDANPDNNSANDNTTVNQLPPDLSITKTHTGNATQGQTGFSYTIAVSNVGTGQTNGGVVTVSDTLPTGLTATAMSGSGWNCSVGPPPTCTRSDVLAPGGSYPPITLTVNVASNAPPSVTNTATVSGGGDTNESNSVSNDPTTVTPSPPDLAIAKSHSVNAVQGQTGFTYTITVSNVGTGASSGAVTVSDTLPSGLTATAISGTGWNCTVGGTSTCNRSDALAAAASYPPITLTVSVASNAPSTVTNTATVTGGGDINTANNTASDPTIVTAGPTPDLAIAKTHTGNAQRGQTGFAYTITVSNVGSAPTAGAVTVNDTLPAGLTATGISGTGWNCTGGATPTCTRSDALASGTAYPPITLTVSVAADAAATVTNTATVSGGGDTNAANNTASDPTTVSAGAADLTITKTHSGNATQGQRNFVYTITASNVGIGPTTGTVTVTDTLPTGLTATAVSGAGWSCTVSAAPNCTRADPLAAGASYPAITLTVNVANDAPATVTNSATVSGGGEANSANNTANDPTTVVGGPVAKSFTFTILAGTSKAVDLTSGATGGPFTGATIVSVTPSTVGTPTITQSGSSFILTFTPPATFIGTAVVTFTLSNSVATSAPATVTFIVANRPDPTKDPDVLGLINTQVATAERFANAQMMNFNQRMETLHEDGAGQDGMSIGFAQTEPRSPNQYVADAYGDLPGSNAYAEGRRPGSASKAISDQLYGRADGSRRRGDGGPNGPSGPRHDFSIWSSGYINFGGSNQSVPGSPFDFTTSGVTFGADYRINRLLTVGLGIGYGRDRTSIGFNGTESRAETYNVSLYESYRPYKGVFIDGILGFGTLKYDSQRFVVNNLDFAKGNRSGSEWFGSVTIGYEYRNHGILLSPYGRLKAIALTLDPFTETGDPTGSLTFSQQSVETITGVLGLRGRYDILMAWGVVSPRFRVEYNHAFQSGGVAALNYADWIGGPTYFVQTQETTSDFATIGLGTDVKLTNEIFVNFDYQTTINAFDTRSHMFHLRAGAKF
jgi:uncharacterized repeat protein (TIGR01451 family)